MTVSYFLRACAQELRNVSTIVRIDKEVTHAA
jgi:hypothetical protein